MNQTTKDALEVVERWSSAFTQSDVDTVMSLFAHDAMFLGTSSKNIVTSTEGIRQYFENSLVGNKRYISELSNSVIDELSDDVVVITSLNKISIIENHRTDIASGRLSIVLRKNEGTWKIAHFHRSAMPE
jgi:uncharacterized protein (TIGR02246 family)